MRRILLALVLIALAGALARAAEARSGVFRGPADSVPPGLRKPSDPVPPPPSPPVVSFADWRFWYHHHKDVIEWRPGRLTPAGKAAGVRTRILDTLAEACRDSKGRPTSITRAALIALGRATDRREHVDVLIESLRHPGHDQVASESAALGLGLLRRSGFRQVFDAALYDRVRGALFAVLEDTTQPARLRGFAACAIGLLGDQPTGTEGWSAAGTTARLFDFLGKAHPHPDLYVSALRASALQPPTSRTDEQHTALERTATEGTIGGHRVGDLVRSHAALAVGATGDAGSLPDLLRLLRDEQGATANVRRSAAIALGLLATRLEAEERASLVHALLETVMCGSDESTRDFALLALLPALVREGNPEALLRQTLAGEGLLFLAAYGTPGLRPYAALTLGFLLRTLSPTRRSPWATAWAAKALDVLRAGLAEGDATTRSAYAVALGIARDATSEKKLRELALDTAQDRRLRGYAALGLGLAGKPTNETLAALRESLPERKNKAHERLCTCALGLLRDEASAAILRTELVRTPDLALKGEAAAALAKIGTVDAAETLLALATDQKHHPMTRAIAYAGLGRILDGEPVPSLARLTMHLNHRASTDLIRELLSIL